MFVGKDPRTGKHKVRTCRVKDAIYTQAKKILRDFIDEVENDKAWKHISTAVGECAEDSMKRCDLFGERSQNAQRRYCCCLKAVNRYIGKADVAQVVPEVIESMFLAMRQGDTATGKPASGTYLNQIHKVMVLMLRDLANADVLVRKPLDKVNTSRVDTKEKRVFAPARMRQLID